MMKLAVFAVLLVVVPLQAGAQVCRGRALEVWVANAFRMTGDGLSDPDPYIKVQIGGDTRKTRVAYSNANPSWFQRFMFYSPRSDLMRIEVWDRDGGLRGDDDHIGTCIEQLAPNGNRFVRISCNVKHGGVVRLFYKCR